MRTALSIVALVLSAGYLRAQAPADVLTVCRPDGTGAVLGAARLSMRPRVTGRAVAHGNAFAFEGADLRDVLRAAGVTPVESLRGPRRILVEGDARPSRWVQQAIRLQVIDVPQEVSAYTRTHVAAGEGPSLAGH